MPQHKKITASRVTRLMDDLEHANQHTMLEATEELLWLLPTIDQFVVKHDRSDLARRLRSAFDRLEAGF